MAKNMRQEGFQIRSYSQQELINLYRCTEKTFRKWLRHLDKEVGPRIGHYYNPRQVRIIVAQLGEP